MLKNVTMIEMASAIGGAAVAAALCLAATAFLMYPVLGQLMVR